MSSSEAQAIIEGMNLNEDRKLDYTEVCIFMTCVYMCHVVVHNNYSVHIYFIHMIIFHLHTTSSTCTCTNVFKNLIVSSFSIIYCLLCASILYNF